MSNKLFVIQQHGYGDVIFSQTLVRIMAAPQDIYWPVKLHMLQPLREAYPDINWIREDLKLLSDQQRRDILTATVVPINRAYEIIGEKKENWMKAKYDMYGIDWNRWKEQAGWKYSTARNNELMAVIGNAPFNLINDTFRNDSTGKIPITVNNGAKNIIMSDPGYESFNLFDWTTAMINAQEIHFVNSAILYMIELLPVNQAGLYIYDRWPDEHKFPFVNYIFTKPYKQVIHPI